MFTEICTYVSCLRAWPCKRLFIKVRNASEQSASTRNMNEHVLCRACVKTRGRAVTCDAALSLSLLAILFLQRSQTIYALSRNTKEVLMFHVSQTLDGGRSGLFVHAPCSASQQERNMQHRQICIQVSPFSLMLNELTAARPAKLTRNHTFWPGREADTGSMRSRSQSRCLCSLLGAGCCLRCFLSAAGCVSSFTSMLCPTKQWLRPSSAFLHDYLRYPTQH